VAVGNLTEEIWQDVSATYGIWTSLKHLEIGAAIQKDIPIVSIVFQMLSSPVQPNVAQPFFRAKNVR
jgi:hypothetical protein